MAHCIKTFRRAFASLCAAALAMATGALADSALFKEAQKEVMKITDSGFSPSTVKLGNNDASLFFVNVTADKLVNISIDFTGKRAHCASDNLKFEAGKLRSVKPIAPRDFALTCFPEPGRYSLEAFGVKNDGKAFFGEVIIE